MSNEENVSKDLEVQQILANIRKTMLEGDKLHAETKWYPFVVGAGVFAAAATFAKIFM